MNFVIDIRKENTDESLSYQLKVPFNKNIKTDY